jgi:hypothetical protein
MQCRHALLTASMFADFSEASTRRFERPTCLNIVLVRLWAYDPILVIPLSPLIHMA